MKPNSFYRFPDDPQALPAEPVTLSEAKSQLRVDHDDDDDYIGDAITVAREFCEDHTGRSFVEQIWRLGYEGWPVAPFWKRFGFYPELVLSRPPVQSITSLKYYPSGSDVLVDLDPDFYKLNSDDLPGVIRLNRGVCLPALNRNYSSPVQVVIVCGPSEDEAAPHRARMAIKQMVTQFYENRVPVVTGTISNEVPLTALDLLARLKIRKF